MCATIVDMFLWIEVLTFASTHPHQRTSCGATRSTPMTTSPAKISPKTFVWTKSKPVQLVAEEWARPDTSRSRVPTPPIISARLRQLAAHAAATSTRPLRRTPNTRVEHAAQYTCAHSTDSSNYKILRMERNPQALFSIYSSFAQVTSLRVHCVMCDMDTSDRAIWQGLNLSICL